MRTSIASAGRRHLLHVAISPQTKRTIEADGRDGAPPELELAAVGERRGLAVARRFGFLYFTMK
jgi:hypothetical protein